MVGKRILHKWVDDGKEKWYTGKVIQAIGDIQDEECGFEIKYNDGDEQIVQLYKEPKERYSFHRQLKLQFIQFMSVVTEHSLL